MQLWSDKTFYFLYSNLIFLLRQTNFSVYTLYLCFEFLENLKHGFLRKLKVKLEITECVREFNKNSCQTGCSFREHLVIEILDVKFFLPVTNLGPGEKELVAFYWRRSAYCNYDYVTVKQCYRTIRVVHHVKMPERTNGKSYYNQRTQRRTETIVNASSCKGDVALVSVL